MVQKSGKWIHSGLFLFALVASTQMAYYTLYESDITEAIAWTVVVLYSAYHYIKVLFNERP